jgi:hypothetical protein
MFNLRIKHILWLLDIILNIKNSVTCLHFPLTRFLHAPLQRLVRVYLEGADYFLRNWQSINWPRNSQPSMETEGSSPCSIRMLLISLTEIHLHHSSMALQPFAGPWPLLQFRNLFYTDGMAPWTGDQLVARPLPTHRTTQTQNKRTHRHSCIEWDSSPRSQCSSERRQFMP